MALRTISIIIPVYNEEKYIREVIRRVIKSDTLKLKKEIIVVNDGSTDRTLSNVIPAKAGIQKNRNGSPIRSGMAVQVVSLKKNSGKSAAVKEGILQSHGDIVLIQDADLEYNPKDYPALLLPFFDQDADAVYGSRFITTSSRRILYYWHSLANMLLTTLSNILTNLNLSDVETGYKVFKGGMIRNVAKDLSSQRFGFEVEVTAKLAKIKKLKLFEVGISYTGRTYVEGKKIKFVDAVLAVYQIIKYNLFTL